MLLNSGRIAQMRFGDKVIDRGEESCHYACEWRVRVRAREGARLRTTGNARGSSITSPRNPPTQDS